MTQKEKLYQKLTRGKISAHELRSLLKGAGWNLDRVRGSHEIWIKDSKTFVLATHGKILKPYQVRAIQSLILGED